MKNVSAILSADWHIRSDTPVCRDEDEYFAAQATKIEFIKELQMKYDCPVLVAGDVMNHWKVSPFLLGWCLEMFPDRVFCVYGQHDLPQHNKMLFQKSGLHVLNTADGFSRTRVIEDGKVQRFPSFCVQGYWYESDGYMEVEDGEGTEVALAHTFTWVGRRPWPGCTVPGASALLNKMQGFDLVVTGDNHKSFTMEVDGRRLVNPGSIMRSNADQADFKPRVYLWNAQTNKVLPVYLPIEKDAVHRDHLDRVQERDERIESFVKKLAGKWDVGLSFKQNLERFFESNEVPENIKQIIREAMERKGQNNA